MPVTVLAERVEHVRAVKGYDGNRAVAVECEVIEPNNRAARRLRNRRGRVPKRRSLIFRVVDTNVPEPFTVYWKVRNHGAEAQARGQLRGQIHADKGKRERGESTSYTGHHYVECYVVKDNVCVAVWNEPVIIN